MKNSAKKRDFNPLLAILIGLALYFVASGMIIGGIFTPKLSYRAADKYYKKHLTDLSAIVNYMEIFPEDVSCSKLHGYGMVYIKKEQRWQEIENEEICQAIRRVFNEGKCSVIDKSNDTVAFTLFYKNKNVFGGIAYTSADNLEVQYLTASKPLSAPSWYYYLCDFNK